MSSCWWENEGAKSGRSLKIAWVTLFEPTKGAGWNNPVVEYYGITGIPTVILVDQEGKVVSLNARGPELGRLLGELLGPAEQSGD